MHPNIQKRERSSSSRKSSFSSSSLSSSVFSTQKTKTSSNVSIGTAIHSASRLAVTSTPAAKFKASSSSSSSISSKNTTTTSNQVETSLSTKRNCLVLANDLLKMCFEMGKNKYMREITSIKQIDSQLFVFIVETILEEELTGL